MHVVYALIVQINVFATQTLRAPCLYFFWHWWLFNRRSLENSSEVVNDTVLGLHITLRDAAVIVDTYAPAPAAADRYRILGLIQHDDRTLFQQLT